MKVVLYNRTFDINYSFIKKLFLFFIAVVLIILVLPRKNKFKYDYSIGKPWKYEDFYALEDIAIRKPDAEIEKERKQIYEEKLPYYIYDNKIADSIKNVFNQSFISDSTENNVTHRNEKNIAKIVNIGNSLIDTVYKRGIIFINSENENSKDKDKIMLVFDKNMVKESSTKRFFTISTANNYISKKLEGESDIVSNALLPTLQRLLTYNVNYSDDFTKMNLNKSLERLSQTRGMIQKGERVVAKGEIIDNLIFQTLETIRIDYEDLNLDTKHNYYTLLGQFLLVALSLFILALYLFVYKPEIFFSNKSVTLILTSIVMIIALSVFIYKLYPTSIYLIPLAIAPIIIRLFFDSKTAIFVHIVIVLLISFFVYSRLDYIVMQLITGIVAVISLVSLEKRSKLFITSIFIFITYSIIYISFYLLQEGTFKGLEINIFVQLLINAAMTMIIYPLIFAFERIFRLTTGISLIELSNTNNFLLRELSIKAPGTFQHSLLVSNIVEEACYEIGANALLGRVGSLYHDIGKLDNPQFFIENQSVGYNPHDELEYDESAKIIVGHVIQGIEKAHSQNIPNEIIDFIRTHHGTRYAKYFYNKFKIAFPNKEPNENIYRYKGPIPRTKETTILMIVDPIEAASRSLKNPTEHNITEIIDNVVKELFENKQFDNSDLTIKEIEKVKNIIKSRLISVYHVRIEYPKIKNH